MPWTDAVMTEFRPDREFSLIDDFRRHAPALSGKVPTSDDDHLGWLLLMQHHGAPTRLLDWTESVLVALYFAVEQSSSEDGELWALFPYALNKQSIGWGFPTSRNTVLRYLAAEAFHMNPEMLAKDFELDKVPESPLAFQPPSRFARVVTQQSTFTIHPKPQDSGTIVDLVTDKHHLVRYLVPARNKRQLMLDLAALGLTRRTLFPDLDSLSRTIVQEHLTIAYSPPYPPECAGEVEESTA